MWFTVQIREAALKFAEDELHKLKSRSDDKVDKYVFTHPFYPNPYLKFPKDSMQLRRKYCAEYWDIYYEAIFYWKMENRAENA